DFHNPTGLVMSASDRAALVRACARAGTLLVVDETFSDLRLDGPELPPPVGAADTGANVATVGTLSKSGWGGLRMGWVRASRRLPGPVATRLAGVAAQHGLAVTPGPAFSVDGTFEQHIRLPYTLPPDDLRDAVARLAALADGLTAGSTGPEPRVALAV